MANFNSVYNFIASDKFSKVLASFEKSSEAAEKKVKKLKDEVAKASTSFDKLKLASNRMKSLADNLKWYSVAATGFLGIGLNEWSKQEKAIAKVSNTLTNTGNKAGLTAKQLEDTASAMSMDSLYGADEILDKVTNRLLLFRNISGDTFSRGQQAAVNMAAALDMDLGQATTMVGNALSRPLFAIQALRKAHVQFTPQQQTLIEMYSKTGQGMKAQAIIMDVLEGKFKNQAKSVSQTQPLIKLKKALESLAQSIATIVIPVLLPLVKGVTWMANALANSHPIIRGVAGAILLLMAVSVPLLLTFSAIAAVMPTLIAGWAMLVGVLKVVRFAMWALTMTPVGLFITAIAAAIAALVYGIYQLIKNWEKVKATFKSWIPTSDTEHTLKQEATTRNQNTISGDIGIHVSSDKGTTATTRTSGSPRGVTFNRGRTM